MKENKKLDNLFSKLSDDRINIIKTNICEEKTVSEDLTKESKLKKETLQQN